MRINEYVLILLQNKLDLVMTRKRELQSYYARAP